MRFSISLIDTSNYIKKFFPNHTTLSLKKTLQALGVITLSPYKFISNKKLECSLLLASMEKMHSLNKEFRAIDKPTDVLSFSAETLNCRLEKVYDANEDSECKIILNEHVNIMHLGDIGISCELIKTNADNLQVDFEYHFFFMFVHSLLHLVGFDHDDDLEASIMEQNEQRVMNNWTQTTYKKV